MQTTNIDAHQKSNVVQMAEGIRTGIPPTNAQINAELEATKEHLDRDTATATTAKEEKTLNDARKLVEAAQTTLVVKNSDEKIQQLAAAMSTLSTDETPSQSFSDRKVRKQYNKFMRRLRDVSLSFANSPSFRKAFLDLIRILREIFNVAANNSGLTAESLRDNLRQQLSDIRNRPAQPRYVSPRTDLLPGQVGYVAPVSQTVLPSGPGCGAPAGTTHLPGQPGYVAPIQHLELLPNGGAFASPPKIPGEPGYVAPSLTGHACPIPGQPGYGSPAGTTLLPGQPGFVEPGLLPAQPGTTLSDIIPEEHLALFRQQLKDFLHEVNAHADTRKTIEELFAVWGSLGSNMYGYFDKFQQNTVGTNIPATAKAVVEEFTGDRTIDDFLEYLRYSILLIESDYELTEFLRECRDYFLLALDDPELIESDDYYNQGSELLQRGRSVTYKYRNEPAIVGLFEEARLLSEEIKNDATLNLLKDRAQAFFGNFVYKDPRTNTPKIDFDLVERMRASLVPFIIERIREIPMPRIELQNKDFEYLIIDDLHLVLGNILPDQVTIHSRSLAQFASQARTTINAVDANAPSTRLGTAHPEHVEGNVGDTNVHIYDDSHKRYHDGYSSDDESSSTSSEEETARPTQVRVGGTDVTPVTHIGAPEHAPVVHTYAPTVVATIPTIIPTGGGVPFHTVPLHKAAPAPAAVVTPIRYTGTHEAGSRIRFRIANIKPEFRNFYFSMKRLKYPAITDEGRMNMTLKGKGLTIIGAFSLVQNAAGVAQISDPRIKVSLNRVKFDVLEAKHKVLLKMAFFFMGRTISRQVERAIQQRLETLIIEWADVLNQKVIPHLPPVDQINQKGIEVASKVADKVVEKTA